jgi:glycosyltransferase involved in cell wall biosynthesis
MRVCEVILAPAIGGAESNAFRLADELTELGHAVDVVALDRPPGDRSQLERQVPVVPRPARVGRKLGRLAALRGHLRRARYDVVLAHTFLPNLYARAASAGAPPRVPVVVGLQSGGDDFASLRARALELTLLPVTAAVVAASPEVRQRYLRRFPAAAGRCSVIPNGVPKAASAPRPLAELPTEFALVGRITPVKSVETAIRGFAEFARQPGNADCRLRIVGPDSDPSYAAGLRRLAAEVGDGRVTFPGPAVDPFAAGRVDVLIHASEHEAGASLAVLEAAARGIPVVCSDWPSIAATIGHNCTTFPIGDWRRLAVALSEVRDDWSGAIERAARAWRLVPDIRETARTYVEVLESVVERRPVAVSLA